MSEKPSYEELEQRIRELEAAESILKKSEHELLKSKVHFQSLFDTMNEGVVVIDPDGQIVQANPSAARILGLVRSEIMKRNYTAPDWKVLRPDGTEMPPEEMAGPRAMKDKRPIDGMVMGVEHPDGMIAWINVSAAPLLSEDGELDGIVATFTDITERINVENKYRESEARWNFALEGAGDGVWDWDVSTNRVYFSNRWKEMLGFSENEIGSDLKEWESRIHPDDKAAAFRDLERHFTGETSVYENEHRVLCKKRTYKWILDRGKVVEWTKDAKPLRVIGTHSDITARKEAEIDRERLIVELKDALSQIKKLSGLLPICSHCKKIRDDQGYWAQIESYIHKHSEAEFSHSICQECAKKYYPDLDIYEE